MIYAYEIEKKDDGFVGYVPDLDMRTKPQENEEKAEDVLTDGLSAYIEMAYRANGKPIPLPVTDCTDKMALYVPIKLQLRILLWNTMLEKHLKQTELAQMLGVSRVVVNQMINGKNAVSVERYEEALKALGKIPDVQI